MQINVVWDASVAKAPAGFVSAINYVVGLFDSLFTNPVSLTIDVGYGEVGGQPLFDTALAEADTTYAYFPYSQVRDALLAHAQSSTQMQAYATLPTIDPDPSAKYAVTLAQAEALGLGSYNVAVGAVGFSSSISWDYVPGTTPGPFSVDFIAAAEHEIGHVLGRLSFAGSSFASIMDLFRFSASGVRQFDAGPAYFSIDNGATDLNDWNANPFGDNSDWAPSAGNDAFDAFGPSGTQIYLSTTDIELTNVLGWDVANPPNTVPAGVTELNQTIAAGGQEIVLAGGQSIGVTINSGSQQTINAGGTATGTTIGGLEIDLGSVSGETVVAGGTLLIRAGGRDTDAVVLAAGAETIAAGGHATSGTVAGTQTVFGTATADKLISGGTIINGSSGVATAVIGGAIGVAASGPGTVINFGTIAGTSGTAVKFGSVGDRLVVEPGSSLVGVAKGGGGTLEFVGGGTIAGLGSTFTGFATYQLDQGVWSGPGGVVAVSAGQTLANLGTLTGAVTLSGAGARVIVGVGSNFTGPVGGGGGTLELTGGAGVITGLGGAGKLSGAASMIFSGFGGYVIDAGASWSLAGGTGSLGPAETLTSAGTLAGSLNLKAATDRVIAENGATFIGAVKGGGGTLELSGGVGTITGLGAAGTLSGADAMSFSGFGAYVIDSGGSWTLSGSATLASGKLLTDGGSLTNLGSIIGAAGGGVDLTANAALVNGSSASPAALIQGVTGVAAETGFVTVTNFGVIKGTGELAVAFAGAGDTLIAESGSSVVGEIAGGGGVLDLRDSSGVIGNLGAAGYSTGSALMKFYGFGTYVLEAGETWKLGGSNILKGGRTLVNSATVNESSGISVRGVFANQGTLVSAQVGVSLVSGGSVVNSAGAVINGVVGVQAGANSHATVVSAGTIAGSGPGAVIFNSAADRLIAEAGSDFMGQVRGGGGTLEIADGSGVISGLGGGGTVTGDIAMTFSGFGAYVIDSGAWTLLGVDNLCAQRLIDGAALADYATLTGGSASEGSGGMGGFGVELAAGASLGVYGAITAGAGGSGASGGGAGGAGGAGVISTAAVSIFSFGSIAGGTGGDGATGATSGAAGGMGGAGISAPYGGDAYVGGYLGGGKGGSGGASTKAVGGRAGGGGAGASTSGALKVGLYGEVLGGAGGAGGTGGGGSAAHLGGFKGGRGGDGGVGIDLLGGGALSNSGTILGGAGGAGGGGGAAFGGGAVGASGSAGADGDGIDFAGSGSVENGAYGAFGALIEGRVGVYAGAGVTAVVTNYGTIVGSSGVAVQFASTNDMLIVGPAASFVGSVVGGGGSLELVTASDTIMGLGVSAKVTGGVDLAFSDFGRYSFFYRDIAMTGLNTLTAGKTLVNGCTLTVSGTLVDEGALTNATFGTLDVVDGATVQAQGLVGNYWTIAVDGEAENTDFRVLAGGVTLSGGGSVNLGGTKARILGAATAATLTNVDNTISGTGFVGSANLTMVNQYKGVINATGGGQLVVGTKGESILNTGLLEASAGGVLVLANATVINAGGSILAQDGARVNLQGDLVEGGAIFARGKGVVALNSTGGELDGVASAVSLSGAIALAAGSREILAGSIVNAGKIDLTAGGQNADLAIGAFGATLSGGGQINLSNSLGNRIYGLAPGDILTNVDNRIDGAGVLGDGTMTLINQAAGRIIGDQNFGLTIDTGINTITNAGLIENSGLGGVLVKSAIANAGTLAAATTGTLALEGAVTGDGVATIDGGALFIEQAFSERVTFIGLSGVLELGASQAFTGKVAGLSTVGTNWLDLFDIAFVAGKTTASYSGGAGAGTLTVTDGAHTARISLIGNYKGQTWTLSSDGHGGTKVIDVRGRIAPLAQAIAAFQNSLPSGLGAWTPLPPQRLNLVHAQA